MEIGDEVLAVDNMQKYYEVHDRSIAAIISGQSVRYVKANEALNFNARQGETVAIVGESGCGKSTFAKVLMGLETATDGEIRHNGKNIGDVSVHARSPQQIGSLQMVFQNPSDTLNPSHTVGGQIGREDGEYNRLIYREATDLMGEGLPLFTGFLDTEM